MSDPELPWKLELKDDGVWFHWQRTSMSGLSLNLGPKEQVMEALSQFLAHEDYGERMDG